jgi:hypothetical protein
MSEESETDVDTRVAELQKRRDAIDAEIERARFGDLPLLGDTALKERFTQCTTLALNDEELRLYDDLRWLRLHEKPVRLEQERIGFGLVRQAVAEMCR